jgi:hypothetical protein
MKKQKTILLLVTATFVLSLVGLGSHYLIQPDVETKTTEITKPVIIPVEELYPYVIPKKSTLSSELRKLNVSSQDIHEFVTAAKPVYDFSKIKPGVRYELYHGTPATLEAQVPLVGAKFYLSPVEMVEIKKVNNEWTAHKITEEVATQVISFQGIVSSTLWESAENAKMDPNLISDLAEIFAWQVDFAREVRVNDRWRIVVEQKVVKGEPYGWGNILAAEYENAGQLQSAVLYQVAGKSHGYYNPKDGSSLRRMFLKSPQ